MSDDIPIIFALELERASAPTAVFLSAATAPQMQQYAAAGWTVVAAQGFAATQPIDLAAIPAGTRADGEIATPTLVSCEAPHLRPDMARRLERWHPRVVKVNCAFHNVADAASLARSLAAAGYEVFAAQWQDQASFRFQNLADISPLRSIDAPAWDRTNLIGVHEPALAHALLTVGRLYAGEERRIAELRLANAIRNDTIARLEDAVVALQPSALFKLQRS